MPPATRKATFHRHACSVCFGWYDDFCADTDRDGTCVGCRGSRVWQLLIDNAAPRECCRLHGRTASPEDRRSYNLVGEQTWEQCAVCRRSWTRKWRERQQTEGTWT